MISIAQAARDIITIEQNEPFPPPARRRVEAAMPRPEQNRFRGWAPQSVHMLHYILRDTVLDGATMVLLHDGQPLQETAYLLPDDVVSRISTGPVAGDGVAHRTIIGSNATYRNYYHWLIQSVPAIDAAVRRNPGRQIRLALRPENDFQRDSLALLGHADITRLTILPDRQYALREAEYSGFLAGTAGFLTSRSARDTFARLRTVVPARSAPFDRIYVARTDAPTRRMRNEDALIEKLRDKGFHIVAPGTLTFRDQVDLFRHAKLVIGPHGAGLSNIVFCEPGTFVYELVPAGYQNSCFTILADQAGLPYWADMFASPGAGEGFTGDWDVDVPAVLRRIDEIKALEEEAVPF
jgi:capsular polysaccharide biosynthesis protein